MTLRTLTARVDSPTICSALLFLYSATLLPFTLYFFMKNNSILLEWELLSISTSSLSLTLILDPIGLSFSNVVCIISACVMLFASAYMEHDKFLPRFTWLVMLFVLSMNLLIFIPNLATLLIGWDGLGIVSFALVIYYQNTKSLAAGMITALANRVGDVMLLISIGICVTQGHWNILFMWPNYFSPVLVFCVLLAAMTKSAQIPFSSWLPAAMAAPTPVSALVHSSTLVTAGVFLLIRFSPLLNMFPWFNSALLLISAMTMFMAGICANFESDMKKVIALSTLSQLGVMMMTLGLGMPGLALFHLYTHALFKALLFLCAGMIIHNNGTQDLRQLGNLWNQMPLTTACFNVANLALCAAPFISGFYSKHLILEKTLLSSINPMITLLFLLAMGLTASYTLRLALFTLFGPSLHAPLHQNQDEDPRNTWPILILSTITIFGGKTMQLTTLQFSQASSLTPPLTSVFTLSIVLVGLLLGSSCWHYKHRPANAHSLSITEFFTSMWHLTPISTQTIIGPPLRAGTTLFKALDQGWLASLTGHGAFLTIKSATKKNTQIQSKLLTTFAMMMALSFILAMALIFTV